MRACAGGGGRGRGGGDSTFKEGGRERDRDRHSDASPPPPRSRSHSRGNQSSDHTDAKKGRKERMGSALQKESWLPHFHSHDSSEGWDWGEVTLEEAREGGRAEEKDGGRQQEPWKTQRSWSGRGGGGGGGDGGKQKWTDHEILANVQQRLIDAERLRLTREVLFSLECAHSLSLYLSLSLRFFIYLCMFVCLHV